jgi:hypothetical protein
MNFVPVLVFFLPTLLAIGKGHPRPGRILLLNLFLAPTGFGWFYVLYLAWSRRVPSTRLHRRRVPGQNKFALSGTDAKLLYRDQTDLPWGVLID